MKTNLIIKLAAIALLFGTLSQCRKGEDDPIISLRSRKARVSGEWTITSGTYSSIDRSSNYSAITNLSYTKNAYAGNSSVTFGTISNSTPIAGTFEYKVVFDKNGEFTMTRSEDLNRTIIKGTWNFTGGTGEAKNKEQIVLFVVNETETFQASSTITSYTGNQVYKTYSITELRNKKMVLSEKGSSISSGGSTSEYKEELILEQ